MEYIGTAEFTCTLAILLNCICYCAYWLITYSDAFKRRVWSVWGLDHATSSVLVQRMTGFLLFACIPYITLNLVSGTSLRALGVSWTASPVIWWYLIISAVVILPLNFFAAGKPAIQRVYPMIRKQEWTLKTFLIEYISIIFYILGYEFLFRGILFFPLMEVMPFAVVVAINVSVYVFAHLPKGWQETAGSLLLGFVLVFGVYQTGSIWVAVGMHLVMALSNSVFSFLRNRDMHFIQAS